MTRRCDWWVCLLVCLPTLWLPRVGLAETGGEAAVVETFSRWETLEEPLDGVWVGADGRVWTLRIERGKPDWAAVKGDVEAAAASDAPALKLARPILFGPGETVWLKASIYGEPPEDPRRNHQSESVLIRLEGGVAERVERVEGVVGVEGYAGYWLDRDEPSALAGAVPVLSGAGQVWAYVDGALVACPQTSRGKASPMMVAPVTGHDGAGGVVVVGTPEDAPEGGGEGGDTLQDLWRYDGGEWTKFGTVPASTEAKGTGKRSNGNRGSLIMAVATTPFDAVAVRADGRVTRFPYEALPDVDPFELEAWLGGVNAAKREAAASRLLEMERRHPDTVRNLLSTNADHAVRAYSQLIIDAAKRPNATLLGPVLVEHARWIAMDPHARILLLAEHIQWPGDAETGPGLVVRDPDGAYRVFRDEMLLDPPTGYHYEALEKAGPLLSPRPGLVWLQACPGRPNRLVNLDTGEVVTTLPASEASRVVAAHPDGRAWTTGAERLFDGAPYQAVAVYHPDGEPTLPRLTPTSRVATAFARAQPWWVAPDGEVWTWNPPKMHRLPPGGDEWEEVTSMTWTEHFEPRMLGLGWDSVALMEAEARGPDEHGTLRSSPFRLPALADAASIFPVETGVPVTERVDTPLLKLAQQRHARLWPAFLDTGVAGWNDRPQYISHPDGHAWVVDSGPNNPMILHLLVDGERAVDVVAAVKAKFPDSNGGAYSRGIVVGDGRGMLLWDDGRTMLLGRLDSGVTPPARVFLIAPDDDGNLHVTSLHAETEQAIEISPQLATRDPDGGAWVSIGRTRNNPDTNIGTSDPPLVWRVDATGITHRLEGLRAPLLVDTAGHLWSRSDPDGARDEFLILRDGQPVATLRVPGVHTTTRLGNDRDPPPIFPGESPGQLWMWTHTGLQEVLHPVKRGEGDAARWEGTFRLGRLFRFEGIEGFIEDVRPAHRADGLHALILVSGSRDFDDGEKNGTARSGLYVVPLPGHPPHSDADDPAPRQHRPRDP